MSQVISWYVLQFTILLGSAGGSDELPAGDRLRVRDKDPPGLRDVPQQETHGNQVNRVLASVVGKRKQPREAERYASENTYQ